MRTRVQGNAHHLVGRRHFEIQRLADLAAQARHVLVADMAAILAQVGGDAVRACRDRQQRRAHRIRHGAAARIAHRRHVVNVDPETQVRRAHAAIPRLPGLMAGMAASSGGSSSGA